MNLKDFLKKFFELKMSTIVKIGFLLLGFTGVKIGIEGAETNFEIGVVVILFSLIFGLFGVFNRLEELLWELTYRVEHKKRGGGNVMPGTCDHCGGGVDFKCAVVDSNGFVFCDEGCQKSFYAIRQKGDD